MPKRKNLTHLKLNHEIIYISQSKNLLDLKDKICRFEKVKNFYSKELTRDNIRMWKINATATHEEIHNTLSEIQSSDTRTISVDYLTYLECILKLCRYS